MTTVYMVRNAELEDMQELSSDLTEHGKVEASKIASFFEGKKVDACFLSTEKSATETLRFLTADVKVKTYVTEEFNERKIGPRVANLTSFTKRQWNEIDYKLPGGETLDEACDRIIDGLAMVVTEHEGETCVIGTHSMAMGVVIRFFDETFALEEYERTHKLRPWIIKLEFEGKTLLSLEEIHCA